MPAVSILQPWSKRLVPFFFILSCTFASSPAPVIAGDPPPEGATEVAQPAVPGATAVSATSKSRLISGAGVRLREKPSTSGKELTRLTMGTEVTELERSPKEETVGGISAPWIKVKTAEGKEGWIFGSFCKPFDPASREELIRSLLNGRIADENLAEGDARELFAWVEKLLAAKPAPALVTEYSLARLQALQGIIDATSRSGKNQLTSDNLKKDPQLAPLEKELVYHELAAGWLVPAKSFWDLHDANRTSPLADEIAWVAACQPLLGESEGYVPAMIARVDVSYGRYLKTYPQGKHAAEAITHLGQTFDSLDASWDPKTADKDELKELKTSVTEIGAAVKSAAAGAERDALLKSVEAFAKRLN